MLSGVDEKLGGRVTVDDIAFSLASQRCFYVQGGREVFHAGMTSFSRHLTFSHDPVVILTATCARGSATCSLRPGGGEGAGEI